MWLFDVVPVSSTEELSRVNFALFHRWRNEVLFVVFSNFLPVWLDFDWNTSHSAGLLFCSSNRNWLKTCRLLHATVVVVVGNTTVDVVVIAIDCDDRRCSDMHKSTTRARTCNTDEMRTPVSILLHSHQHVSRLGRSVTVNIFTLLWNTSPYLAIIW